MNPLTAGIDPRINAQLSLPAASQILARWTLKRILRGKGLWICLLIMSWPAVQSVIDHGHSERIALTSLCLALALVAPMLCGGAIAEEVSDGTSAYLFTRPFPRTALLVGRLAGTVPILWMLSMGSMLMAREQLSPSGTILDLSIGLLLGCLGFAMAAMASGTIVVKRGIAAAVAYLLALDTALSELPFSLHNISVSFHTRELAAGGPFDHAIWLLALTSLFFAFTVWRLRRL